MDCMPCTFLPLPCTCNTLPLYLVLCFCFYIFVFQDSSTDFFLYCLDSMPLRLLFIFLNLTCLPHTLFFWDRRRLVVLLWVPSRLPLPRLMYEQLTCIVLLGSLLYPTLILPPPSRVFVVNVPYSFFPSPSLYLPTPS